jgi:putative phosphoesterase
MRIGVISDLHVDLNENASSRGQVVRSLSSSASRKGVELLLVAGDIANRWDTTLRSLEALESASGLRVLFVPGNHDVWNEAPAFPLGPGWGAWDSYRSLEAFPGNLGRGPVDLPGGWSVIGDLGWYDYAFGHPRYSTEDFDRMRFGERLWQDKVNALWDRCAGEMHRHFRDKLERQLAGRRGGRLILVTHAVSHRAFTVQPPDPQWEYLNAFLGSPEYGELAVRHGAALAVCGHVHYRRRAIVEATCFVCSCLGYATEWADPRDIAGEVERALAVLDL